MRKTIHVLTLLATMSWFLGVSDPLSAQETITFVNNLTAPDSGFDNITKATPAFQKFTTGNYSNGYTLTSLTVYGNNMGGGDQIRITLLNDNSGAPGESSIATFSNPSSYNRLAYNTFTISTTLTLNTKYWIKFSNNRNSGGDYKIGRTVTDYESGLDNAWSVGDNRLGLDSDDNYSVHDRAIRIRLKGTVTNTPATGTLTISGNVAQAGERLTANTGSIVDANGKPSTSSYKYQWIRIVGTDEIDISGATSKTYRLRATDAGAKVKVTMSFTDKGGYNESFTSAVFPATGTITNTAPTAANGSVTAEEDTDYAFQVDDFNFMDADSSASLDSITVVSVLPMDKGALTLDGTAVTTGQTISADDIDDDKLKYTPPANIFGDGYTSFTFKVNDGEAESANFYTLSINIAPVNDAPRDGGVGLHGDYWVGNTIASLLNVVDPDGLTSPEYTYQWFRVSVDADGESADSVAIPGATRGSYKLTKKDLGKRIKLQVSYQDDSGYRETVYSDAFPFIDKIINPPFVARFSEYGTGEKNGKLRYYVDLILNEYVFVSFKDLRDYGFTTTNGTVRGVKRLNRK